MVEGRSSKDDGQGTIVEPVGWTMFDGRGKEFDVGGREMIVDGP